MNKLSYQDAYSQNITTSTLLLSMNDINIDVACEARFALERSCVPLACARRSEEQLSVMRRELHRQTSPDLSDENGAHRMWPFTDPLWIVRKTPYCPIN